MNRDRGSRLAVVSLCVAALTAATASGPVGRDPLAAEIERWSDYVRDTKSDHELWTQIRESAAPLLTRAGEALRDGRRLLALQRMAPARTNLAAFSYVASISPAQRKELKKLEAEWAQTGRLLRADPAKTRSSFLAGVQPAAIRAMAEAAVPQARVFYEASLEYGRNTMADAGFFYLGSARAQHEFPLLCRRLSTVSSLRPPPLRRIEPELDSLEGELLAAYRPPAAIEKHGEFIAASAALKEARELEAAGLLHGALLRYLQAAQRSALLRPKPPTLDAAALAAGMRDLESRLAAGGIDHSVGRLFLESAQAETASAPAGGPPSPVAAAIVSDVQPRYFEALAPRGIPPPKPAPRVTVTLVRWPYT